MKNVPSFNFTFIRIMTSSWKYLWDIKNSLLFYLFSSTACLSISLTSYFINNSQFHCHRISFMYFQVKTVIKYCIANSRQGNKTVFYQLMPKILKVYTKIMPHYQQNQTIPNIVNLAKEELKQLFICDQTAILWSCYRHYIATTGTQGLKHKNLVNS